MIRAMGGSKEGKVPERQPQRETAGRDIATIESAGGYIVSSFLANRVSSQRLLRLVEIGLAVALVLALADLVRQGSPEPQDAGKPALSATGTRAGPASQAQAAAPDGLSPALLSLFGASRPGGALAEGPAFAGAALPETGLDLTLKGVIARRDSDRKLALIAQGGGKEEVYWLGDRVAGAEIVGIGARRVVLLRDNIRETLTLEEAKLREDAGNGRRQTPRVAGAPPPREVGASNWGVSRLSEHQRVVARSTLDQHLGSLPSLLRQAKAVPYLSNGEPAGFRVVGIDKDSVFEELGLRREDVIVAVNGVSVRNIQEALAAYRSFRSAEAVRLDLLRGGREVSLDFSIQ